jgi:hypothetical protein
MATRRITFKIRSDGTVEAEAYGFQGPVCSETIKKLFAGKVGVQEETHKSEHYGDDQEVLSCAEVEGGGW